VYSGKTSKATMAALLNLHTLRIFTKRGDIYNINFSFTEALSATGGSLQKRHQWGITDLEGSTINQAKCYGG
jgi:hypothetical protein